MYTARRRPNRVFDAVRWPGQVRSRAQRRASTEGGKPVDQSRKFSVVVVLAVSVVFGACGYSEEEMQAKKDEIAALNAKLSESVERGVGLEARLKEMSDKNTELMERLNLAGTEKGTLSASLAEKEKALEELRARERQAQARLKTFQDMVDKFRAMIDSGKLRVRVVRGRMVVELSENILFDSGKSDLKKEGQEALTQVASVLASIANRDFQIAGHTDNIPIKSNKFPSNWELSTARSVTVARFLAEKCCKRAVGADRVVQAGWEESVSALQLGLSPL
jgi:chemotaxis protein MotB